MANKLGSLTVLLKANSRNFTAGMKQAGQATKTFEKTAKRSLTGVRTAVRGLGGSLRALTRVAAIGAAGGVAGIGFAVRLAAEAEELKRANGLIAKETVTLTDILKTLSSTTKSFAADIGQAFIDAFDVKKNLIGLNETLAMMRKSIPEFYNFFASIKATVTDGASGIRKEVGSLIGTFGPFAQYIAGIVDLLRGVWNSISLIVKTIGGSVGALGSYAVFGAEAGDAAFARIADSIAATVSGLNPAAEQGGLFGASNAVNELRQQLAVEKKSDKTLQQILAESRRQTELQRQGLRPERQLDFGPGF